MSGSDGELWKLATQRASSEFSQEVLLTGSLWFRVLFFSQVFPEKQLPLSIRFVPKNVFHHDGPLKCVLNKMIVTERLANFNV